LTPNGFAAGSNEAKIASIVQPYLEDLNTYLQFIQQMSALYDIAPAAALPACDTCSTTWNIPALVGVPDGTPTINVVAGVIYTITTTGLWNGGAGGDVGPNGRIEGYQPILVIPGTLIYQLIGRIGGGAWFNVLASLTFTAGASGRLSLMMNDGNDPAYYVDNSGSLTATIS